MIFEISPIKTEKFVLDKTKFGATMAQSTRLEVEHQHILDSLIYRLEAEVLTQHLATTPFVGETVHKHPATSWQMFKWEHAESWWLGWLVGRRPVRFAEHRKHVQIELQHNFIYPEANILTPDLGRPVIYERVIS